MLDARSTWWGEAFARWATVLGGLAGAWVAYGQGGTTWYFYDDGSQPFRVLDPAGILLEWVYDPVGNILEIKRSTVAPGALSILNVAPQYAKPGTAIRIYGQYFAPTAAGNVVRFNGSEATVISASATELVVTLPAVDTTGTVGAQTAPLLTPMAWKLGRQC